MQFFYLLSLNAVFHTSSLTLTEHTHLLRSCPVLSQTKTERKKEIMEIWRKTDKQPLSLWNFCIQFFHRMLSCLDWIRVQKCVCLSVCASVSVCVQAADPGVNRATLWDHREPILHCDTNTLTHTYTH